ncbi:hypothetical protein FOXG_22341 [Fusarium oxysporum f. sp. lycopersici 4287]|uniref:Uncharacterized protein n=1 Tax=Fusarium oxysporum f. sp. lycopersici (strain 4287 / CBS 123668 / FGSC 9935 / NRRL 34936) TaxID=426428 RepID=A0A0J9WV08_FUSO4|nr:hypothetical protein FOXG_22341 [Fusarium oxysporum f. sp. lycopersici 4287]KNB18707.1 hypothetical protein FOXG_22341 [Fusarium oxysporum f. sp. lycopersici 4287]
MDERINNERTEPALSGEATLSVHNTSQQFRLTNSLKTFEGCKRADAGNCLTFPTAQLSPSDQASTHLPMSLTQQWSPAGSRRPSYSMEEYRHELHMALICDVKTGPGFSEGSCAYSPI